MPNKLAELHQPKQSILKQLTNTTMRHTKYLLFILAATLLSAAAYADDVTFHASAPAQVVVGTPFQLSYTVNQRGKDFRAPEIDGFDVLAGPYTSQSSSTQFINGKRTSSFQLTYTYTLMAQREGSFTIPPASITVGHESYNSNGLKITVLPPDEQPQTGGNTSQQAGQASARQGNPSQPTGSDKDIFVRTLVSKTKVYEQECIVLSYKLYTLVDVAQLTNNTKIPEFSGFVKQELDLGQVQTNLEHYDGRNYQTAVIYQTLLYPQHSGDIKIEPAAFEAIVRVRNRSQVRSIFDDFFDTYSNVSRQLGAPGVTVHVSALPSGRPAGFSGGVGQLKLNSSISQTELQTNEAVTLKIDISGTGNLKMLKTPQVEWPEGFEAYDPKVQNNFKTSAGGMSGSKSIEYLAIPRASGTYTIPSVQYSYFDPQSGTYKSLSTPEYTLTIAKGEGAAETVVQNYVDKENIKQLGQDIRHIYTGELEEAQPDKVKFGTLAFWLCYLIPLLIALTCFIILRKYFKDNADLSRSRYRKAGKVAQKRLKTARAMLAKNDRAQFYEEIERAVLTYLSDRLSIPTAELNKDNIDQLLRSRKVDERNIQQLHDLLSRTEFARYAPAQSDHDMQDVYNETADILSNLNI